MELPPDDDQIESNSNITSEYVKLNVGGMLFYTTISTLTKFKDNMLGSMFSRRMNLKTDEEGWVLIDRCGKHFGVILNFLRDGTVALPNRKSELDELRAEANFFCVAELVELCDRVLLAPINTHTIGPSTTIVLAEPLDKEFIKNLTKPAIILEQASNHFDYLPKNLKFFEKLASDFHEHIIFIRYNNSEYTNRWIFCSKDKSPTHIQTDNQWVLECEIYNALAKLLQTLIPKI